jgi:hypothetical protein
VSSKRDSANPSLGDLAHPISSERLGRYRRQSSETSEIEAIANYFWNINLSEALYPSLHALEISLRNSIHTAACSVYRSEFWFDTPELLIRWQPTEIQRAREHLARMNKPQNPGRIIAELRLGFWTTLLSGPYERRLWKPNGFEMLRLSFPYMPPRFRTRKRVYDRFNKLRQLRNRVFHFEPIFDSPTLVHDHNAIVEAINWISPKLAEVVTVQDRFMDVHRLGWAQVRHQLSQLQK